MHPSWLSNAYLVAAEDGDWAVFVDSGAPMQHLQTIATRWEVKPTHILRTHADPDHVEHEAEFGLPVVTGSLDLGATTVDAIPTPGHSDDHAAFLFKGQTRSSGDVLFKDAVGGGDPSQVRESVMRLMDLPPETRVFPG